ncbi:MAG TPA: hypothetical protein VJ508_14355 [Saprospiraceae bacterium]|nr:hypothetical protein [Saprospiraceae bacterium]
MSNEETNAFIDNMIKRAKRMTEALGWPIEDMPIVMAALYRDRLPQQLLDEVNELAEIEQEESGEDEPPKKKKIKNVIVHDRKPEAANKQEDTAGTMQESKQEET